LVSKYRNRYQASDQQSGQIDAQEE
jgi:hypothetical protein